MGSLQFRLLGTPVVVEPWFWLTALLLGMPYSPQVLPSWIAAVFVAVLVHEFGHALAGRANGLVPAIRLQAFGGITWWASGRTLPTWQSVAISFAGPGAGFALAAVLWGIGRTTPVLEVPFLGPFVLFSILVNVFWGILNLLPVLPLDGGNIMRVLVRRYVLRPATELPLQISIATAALVALVAWGHFGQLFLAIFMGYLGFMNYQELQRTWRPRRY